MHKAWDTLRSRSFLYFRHVARPTATCTVLNTAGPENQENPGIGEAWKNMYAELRSVRGRGSFR